MEVLHIIIIIIIIIIWPSGAVKKSKTLRAS